MSKVNVAEERGDGLGGRWRHAELLGENQERLRRLNFAMT